MTASRQDGTYPRPQLCRPHWQGLDGEWAFSFDDDRAGLREHWFRAEAADRFAETIVVPFPPECAASGVGDRTGHSIMWYRRVLTSAELAVPSTIDRPRLLLHFGAVDYRADVWVDGHHVAHHIGGHAPFSVDITDALDAIGEDHVLVVRAEDDPHDLSQPRGKQTWHAQPEKVWYERTSGIWQSVWLEAVPDVHVTDLVWQADPEDGVRAVVEVTGHVLTAQVRIVLELDGRRLGEASAELVGNRVELAIPVHALTNSIDREDLVWSPEQPVLIDATVSLVDSDSGAPVDTVASYFGIRRAGVGGGRFLLNGRPYFLAAVLNQGYRADTHLANAGTAQLRGEIELAKSMGFNAMRIHQKAEDPRILFWADRLGLLIWAEIGATYEFSATAVEQLTTEWLSLVRRDRSHPAVVAWVPINESWGLPNLGGDSAQRHFAAAIAGLTRPWTRSVR